jgi:RNA polymerase sigma factor (sigma-70 family)
VEGPKDGELLDDARGGDREAWATLVRRHSARLWRVARANGLDGHESADVVQYAWLQLCVYADDIRQPEAVAGWLNRVVRHEAIRRSKRLRREQPTDGIDADNRTEDDLSRVFDAEDLDRVRWALTQIGEPCATLISMLFSNPPASYREIADRFEQGVNWVGPTRARCLEKLRRKMSDEQ